MKEQGLTWKKQEEEISKKYDFFDDDDDKKDDISIKMEDNFPDGDNDDVLIKKKVIMKWMMGKQFPTHFQKGKMIMKLTKREQFSAHLQEGKVKMKLTKKYIRNLN